MTKIEIINLALLRIGQGMINEVGPSTPQGAICSLLYDHCVRHILSSYDWNFARKREYLLFAAELSERERVLARYDERIAYAKRNGWTPADIAILEKSKRDYILDIAKYPRSALYLYNKPIDCARIMPGTPPYEYIHRMITIVVEGAQSAADVITPTMYYGLASDVHPFKLEYVTSDLNLIADKFPDSFIDLLSISIALRLTKTFNDSLPIIQGLSSLYEITALKAKAEDCQQMTVSHY